MTTVHIINHTHWDREWFLTAEYTTQWIPGLIGRINQLVASNPDFTYLFDGQTLFLEDLITIAPEYQSTVAQLIRQGNLIIGPYYCQPDWQLTNGETLIRNLQIGLRDVQRYSGTQVAGWLVDTFGHISQAPQIHRLFDLDTVFVWRGVPQLVPYFEWVGANQQPLFAIDLFGGYRNLYGVTHVPELAVKRLQGEVSRLQSYYPTPDIPLFDGYDLEDNPEDPLSFYEEHIASLPPDIELRDNTPYGFGEFLQAKLDQLPTIDGELNSGKFGATFPGTISSRVYLKVMSHQAAQMLYQRCEPLAVMASLRGRPYPTERYDKWTRQLLQNAVHDCICGVSIDQVHEKMAYSYRQLFEEGLGEIQESLPYVLRDFESGTYAVSTNPFPYSGGHVVDGQYVAVKTDGIGIWPVGDAKAVTHPMQAVNTFGWENDHYTAQLGPDGRIQIGETALGYLVVSEEHGDTYSDELGPHIATLSPKEPPVVVEQSTDHCVIEYECALKHNEVDVSASVKLIFDESPLIRWDVALDSSGTNFRVEMVFAMNHSGQVLAGMPFDVVNRPFVLDDLLPRELDADLTKILSGQREIGAVQTFPFHDFVAISNPQRTSAIFAKGIYAYRAEQGGTISVTLRRSVEWVTAADLKHRVGDAGPFFYVPDARCERSVRHELAVLISSEPVDSIAFQERLAAYQNPPLIVSWDGDGPDRKRTSWQWLAERLPMSSLQNISGQLVARFYNPTSQTQAFSRPYKATDVWGDVAGQIEHVKPKQIVNVQLEVNDSANHRDELADGVAQWHNPPMWQVGNNHGLPDQAEIDSLRQKALMLSEQMEVVQAKLDGETDSAQRYRLQHRYYVLHREKLEYELSARLNELKMVQQNQITHDYLYKPHPDIRALGLQLNKLRIKRRIFDYVIQAV